MISIINVFSLSHTVVRGLLLLSIRLTSEDGVRVSAMKNMTSASFSLRTQQQPGKNMIQKANNHRRISYIEMPYISRTVFKGFKDFTLAKSCLKVGYRVLRR